MLPRSDLMLYDKYGRLTAYVEVKSKFGTSREWAAQLRRNLFAHGGLEGVDFFLLATPDRLYVWKKSGSDATAILPDFVVDAKRIFDPYFKTANINSRSSGGFAFELVVGSWLADLARSGLQIQERSMGDEWIIESGFLDAIENGRVEYEDAA
jgi:hypothetical protein